jgi:hypothetical protein
MANILTEQVDLRGQRHPAHQGAPRPAHGRLAAQGPGRPRPMKARTDPLLQNRYAGLSGRLRAGFAEGVFPVQWLARLAGFEPATRCLEVTFRGWRDVAWGRLMCHLSGLMNAGRGLASPGICGWWLPRWLPGISLASLMFERSNLSATGDRRHAMGATGMLAYRLEPASRGILRVLTWGHGSSVSLVVRSRSPGHDAH